MSSQKPKRELQPEQAAAAHTIDRHISVTAGPGSGKTTVLVERYLHILLQHKLSIDQIVAITFTNRAANEMRERLREQLNHLLQNSSAEQRKQWLGYKRTLDGAVITTIHGFCARLLREFPVEARVDPQFLLLDEHRAAMLLDSVVEEVLREFIVSGHVKISALTLGVGRGKLATALAQMYREVRGQGLSLNDLKVMTARSHATEAHHTEALGKLAEGMKGFLRLRRTTSSQRANQSEVAAGWAALEPLLQTIPAPESLADYCRTVEGFRKVRPQARGDFTNHVRALDELVWEKDLAGRVPQLCLDLFARQYALELINVLNRIDERLNEEKQKMSALDFDDLELKALELLQRPEVITRAAERYKFFLVDEFQDTNGLQRELLERLALQKSRREQANLFIVGDRKQSIYGFRGADVDVFREMSETLNKAGGRSQPLLLNFRSQPPLVNFFNYLFERLFEPKEDVSQQERNELGYVAHEPSEAKRKLRDSGPLVELIISTETPVDAANEASDPKAEQTSRELDAEQLARRIRALVDAQSLDTATADAGIADTGTAGVPPASSDVLSQVAAEPGSGRDARDPSISDLGVHTRSSVRAPRFSDIALLFRAMTNVQIYESAFRRANIPYQTVLGRGFYEREEITDLIQLLRFLDNKTDELALAAVLRSPLVGLSDNALLALRCAPWLRDIDTGDPVRHFTQTRRLFTAVRRHREIAHISDPEHELLDRAASLISELVARRHHYSLTDLLRYAVEESEYLTVVAANFDGAQRLANIERLFTLAARFEQSGNYLIRDFVRYVADFEAIGSRESEGQIDEAANAVRLMTIHQAKGLEFPIVIIPELQRYSRVPDNWFLLDRHRGLTLKVPDGRGKLVAGSSFSNFEQRNGWREEFESMRLLYVAATRAEDRLIFSGTTKDFASLNVKTDTWLKWIWQSLGLETRSQSGVIELADGVEMLLTLNPTAMTEAPTYSERAAPQVPESAGLLKEAFPLLRSIPPGIANAVQRFSVTQLINYQRCPRQYYFERVLRVPSADELAVWNNAEAPEPPANLNATLKGAVIHRFCETYSPGDVPEERLKTSFADVIRSRQAQLADRLEDINADQALKELWPLAQNYLSSEVFQRVEQARRLSGGVPRRLPANEAGLWSELSFRVRRPKGILTGTIDKLLIYPASAGGLEIEIIDFKTNRIGASGQDLRVQHRAIVSTAAKAQAAQTHAPPTQSDAVATRRAIKHSSGAAPLGTPHRHRSQFEAGTQQFELNFSETTSKEKIETGDGRDQAESPLPALEEEVRLAAFDYQLQMQAYALAVQELMPDLARAGRIKVTLHFLHPNVEWALSAALLEPTACAEAIDAAMHRIIASCHPEDFPVHPARHCRMCSFLRVCAAGRRWVADH